jgi:hypothetical protein
MGLHTPGTAVLCPLIVILNLFQDNAQPSRVILKQVQDDEEGVVLSWNEMTAGQTSSG